MIESVFAAQKQTPTVHDFLPISSICAKFIGEKYDVNTKLRALREALRHGARSPSEPAHSTKIEVEKPSEMTPSLSRVFASVDTDSFNKAA